MNFSKLLCVSFLGTISLSVYAMDKQAVTNYVFTRPQIVANIGTYAHTMQQMIAALPFERQVEVCHNFTRILPADHRMHFMKAIERINQPQQQQPQPQPQQQQRKKRKRVDSDDEQNMANNDVEQLSGDDCSSNFDGIEYQDNSGGGGGGGSRRPAKRLKNDDDLKDHRFANNPLVPLAVQCINKKADVTRKYKDFYEKFERCAPYLTQQHVAELSEYFKYNDKNKSRRLAAMWAHLETSIVTFAELYGKWDLVSKCDSKECKLHKYLPEIITQRRPATKQGAIGNTVSLRMEAIRNVIEGLDKCSDCSKHMLCGKPFKKVIQNQIKMEERRRDRNTREALLDALKDLFRRIPGTDSFDETDDEFQENDDLADNTDDVQTSATTAASSAAAGGNCAAAGSRPSA